MVSTRENIAIACYNRLMRKLLVGLLLLLAVVAWILSLSFKKQAEVEKVVYKPSPTIVPQVVSNTILFVPYWTLQNTLDTNYSEYIYFGITPDKTGIARNEEGFEKIPLFLHKVPSNAKKFLGVRMTNSSINEYVLQNDDVQQKVIADAVAVAKEDNFDGVVLDLEYNAFPFESVIKSVTNFSKRFSEGAKGEKLLFYQTFYGDTYYRGRPYDIRVLAKQADKTLVMTYDFHKANADPGANFPFDTGDEGYSFKEMVGNFIKDVPSSKISIIFGMFGYDWKVSEKGTSVGQAESLSDNEIAQKFKMPCQLKNCSFVKNEAMETKVTYEDDQGQRHVVWFEDKASVEKKKDFLEENGISSIGYWANGFF